MKSIDALVRAKLEAHAGHEETIVLWGKLWAAHEVGGAEGARSFLASLLDPPAGEDDGDDEGGGA